MIPLSELVAALPSAAETGGVAVVAGALALGLRHGIDWDHIAAITDITSSAAADDSEEEWLIREPGLLLTDESHHALADESTMAEHAHATPVAMGVAAQGASPTHRHTHDEAHPHDARAHAAGATVWERQRRPIILGTLYALGHGAVVIALGLLALLASSILPEWIDPIMGRLVGVTLLMLAGYLYYSVYRFFRGGEFRMRSRWMLLFSMVRAGWSRLLAWIRRHPYHRVAHTHQQYGPRTAFGIGAIHGIGAETGTQVLLIAAAAGASSTGAGVVALFAFVTGVLISNSVVTLASTAGFISTKKRQWLYVGAGILAATFSLVIGLAFVLGEDTILPDLDPYLQWIGGPR